MSSVSVRFNSFLFFIRFSMNTVPISRLTWSVWMDSNHRPHAYQACALTTWATDRFLSVVPRSFPSWFRWFHRLVEMMGFEPMTPCLQGRCSPSWATPPYHGLSFSKIISDLRKLNNKSFRTACFRSRQSTTVHSWKRTMVSIERRWSSRTFRYGYLVTT